VTGIPTTYEGIRFRSRVEARWAATFDRIGWAWEYEPIDLAGYIPDFIVSMGAQQLLVEVKSTIGDEDLAAAQQKIGSSGWHREAVILPAYLDDSCPQPVVGWFGERETGPDGAQLVWGEARAFRCLSCGWVSVMPADGSWRCRSCGVDDGNAHVGGVGSELSDAWSWACNRVQWRAA
jgi:hypothetical protein